MNYLKKIKKMLKRSEKEVKMEDKNIPVVVYENKHIEKECNEWVKCLSIDSFGVVLLDIGFKPEDVVYLYDNGYDDRKFYYSVNVNEKNLDNSIHFCYGAFMDRGALISLINSNRKRTFAISHGNKFVIDLEETKISDDKEYLRYYFSFSALFRFINKDYELRLNIYRNVDNDDIFRLENESELERYLCSLEFPVSILDVYKKICEICSLNVSNFDEFGLELCKKTDSNKNNGEIVSHIKFIGGKFVSLSYMKDDKRIDLNSSGDWSYEMISDDNLAKLSINVKDDNINCNVTSNNDKEIDDYFKYLALYDLNTARCEIEEAKKLVRSKFDR